VNVYNETIQKWARRWGRKYQHSRLHREGKRSMKGSLLLAAAAEYMKDEDLSQFSARLSPVDVNKQ